MLEVESPVAARTKPPDFNEFYHACYGRLAAQLSAYLGDAAEAEDVVQEALLRAWSRWGQVSRYEEPVAWVRRVAWNMATSRWRRIVLHNRVLRRGIRAETVEALGPDNVALVAALRQIPAQQRRAIVLHYFGDLTVATIATELGVARGTVLSWLHRGRARLATLLADAPTEGGLS
ncbi:RNA polymerase sigma24 factor [Longispora fulva]|uniref:RNA polymerase sigma-70 factor (ECF subfamily) n=1 Tax=Longispora fulva TaxID=619741 RepID=A0A8J7KK52_9ACTN|nr:SigE family RNA polymerase sigma factor [Longispora fulva]MBG6136266.1 RNA polymerase sigma-70 factor (ECF subfamily) [Longispora fulva]GIG63226.1 RNA polymerase sigma24 factor [Longispora fulva]